jgi:hypothetical protein
MELFYNNSPYITIPNTAVIYCHILTQEKEVTMVIYHSIFITLAPGALLKILLFIIVKGTLHISVFGLFILIGSFIISPISH